MGRPQSVRRAGGIAAACALALSLLVFVLDSPAGSAVVNPFGVRFQTNDNGAIRLFGDTVLSCPTAAVNCVNARNGTGPSQNNNNFTMQYVDADGAAFPTFNSSRDLVTLPDGSSILWAGLYWGARLDRGTGGVNAPASGRDQMKLRPPGSATYLTITGQVLFGPTGADDSYQRFADVTSIAQAAGPGDYWGADIAAATGEDRYGGWSLVVVFRNPTMPLRNLTVFDGFAEVSQGNPATVALSGFLAPRSGRVETQLGMVAYEGDRGSTGDQAVVKAPPNPDTQLASTLSLGTNFFNSTYDINGTSVTTRTPADLNMFGFDIKNIGAPGAIPNGATSAQIQFTSTGETYLPGVLTTIIDLFSPNFTSTTKTAVDLGGNNPAAPGDQVQYTLNYVNSGDDPANASVTTDGIPVGTTYVPGSLERFVDPNWVALSDTPGDDIGEFVAGAGPRGEVDFRLGSGASPSTGGTIAGGGGADSVRFRVTIDNAAAGTTISNQASLDYVAATLGDDLTYVTNVAQTPVQANADLAIAKVTTPDPAAAGGTVTSRLDVTNGGPNPAEAVVATDTLPPEAVFVSATASQGSCAFSSGTVTCSLGTVAVGGPITVTVVATTASTESATSLTNQATVSSPTTDPVNANNATTSTVALRPEADLHVDKTGPPGPVLPGAPVPFTIHVTNAGPSPAAQVRVGDQVGPGLQLITGTAPCVTFPCLLGDVPAGATIDIPVNTRLSSSFIGTQVTNTASVTSPTFDPNPAARVDTVTVPVGAPRANLTILKTATVGSVIAGDTVRYRLSVINFGPSDATNVSVVDPLGPGVTATGVTSNRGSCTSGAGVSCAIDRMPPGATATILVTAAFDPDVPPGPFFNTATVSSATADPDLSNNSATDQLLVGSAADLVVSKTATPNPIDPNQPVTYTVTVTNNGPSTARSASLTDTLPVADFAFASALPSQGSCAPLVGAALSCALGDVPDGGRVTVTVVMDVPASFDGHDVTNSATVESDSFDPNPGNNTAAFTSSSNPQADLAVTKTASPEPVIAGEGVTYTVTVSNNGPFAATDVALQDLLPAGTSVVGASGAGFTCTTGPPINCTIPSLAVGASATVTVTATVANNLAFGSTITNTAAVTATTPDPTTSNNSAAATSTVATRPDLVTSKQLIGPAPPLFAGGPIFFQVTVTNQGSSLARQVTLDDAVPAIDLQIDDVQGDVDFSNCDIANGDLLCSLGDMAPGDTVTFTLTANSFPDQALGDFANVATAATTTPEPDQSNNQSVAPFSITDTQADVIVTKDGPSLLDAGAPFTYRLHVADGALGALESDAQDVIVTDNVPAGLSPSQVQSTQGNCTIAGQVVTCLLGTVSPIGFGVDITITGTSDASLSPQTVTNTATATTSSRDTDLSSNAASFATQITQSADLSVTKVPDNEPLTAGSAVSYTVTVSNAGPSAASSVMATDVLPGSIAFDPDTSDVRCSQAMAGGPVDCAIPFILPGDSVVLKVAGTFDPAFTGSTVANSVTVTSPTPDPNDGDNVVTITTDANQVADLVLTKTPENPTPAAGAPDGERYHITLRNNGPSDASDVVLTDSIPPGTTLLGTIEAQPDLPSGCTVAGDTITCPVGTLPAGASQTIAVTVHIPASFPSGPLSNTATATTTTGDQPRIVATATVDVAIVADLEVTKTLVTDPIVAGQPVTFAFSVTNNGPSDAPDVLFSDTLPAGLFIISGLPDFCTPVSEEGVTVVSCQASLLPAGQTVSDQVTFGTSPDLTGTLSNTAIVGSGALDNELFAARSQNQSTASGPVTAEPDVAVTVTADADTINPGSPTGFTVTVTNDGASEARGVQLTNTLPDGLTDVTVDGCTINGSIATCDLGDIAPGDDVTLHFTGVVADDVPAGAVLVDSASVTAAGDTVASNDNASAQTLVVATPVEPPTTVIPTRVTSPPAGPSVVQGSGLARTGVAVTGLVAVGLGLVVAGALLRRRRAS